MRNALFAVAAGLAVLVPTAARAGPMSVSESVTQSNATTQTNYEVVLQGDVTGQLLTASGDYVNPFGGGAPTANFDGTNTTLTFSDSSISNGMTVQFGYELSSPATVLSQYWSPAGSGSEPEPALSVVTSSIGATSFFDVFVELTLPSGQTTGDWLEVPYAPGASVQVVNNSSSPITLSDAGYLISPTQIPLDQLNFTDEPPPGQSGSPFISLPSLDGTTLAPGGSASITPEPSSLALLAVGSMGLLTGHLRRRQRLTAA